VNNLQETLLFPVRDAEASKQFLIACAIMLASFFIPLLPMFVIMGYSIKIMRQIIDERKVPSMPSWREIDWAETFMDGLKLFAVQLVLLLPLFFFLGIGIFLLLGGSISLGALSNESTNSQAPIAGVLFAIGIAFTILFSLLSLPYGVIMTAAVPHVATKRSFASGFEFQEWWAIFRKGIGQFILAYALYFLLSIAFGLIMQIAIITIVLICIVPLLMIPYTVYLMLIGNALYAQAYVAGREALQAG
jgi:hypothetical protein